MPAFVDSHAHLDGSAFESDREETVNRAYDSGLTHIVCIGASDGFESNQRTLDFVDGRPGFYATVGIHPHDANIYDANIKASLLEMATHPQVVAIGETGLDYYYDQSPREAQKQAFEDFVSIAHQTRKPLIIHTRDAEADTLDILRQGNAEQVGGVLHCFTGSLELAEAAVDMGFYVSFSGILTFKSAGALRDIAKSLPRERILVETDCPYLAPVPMRGKRNEPAFIEHTACQLAELWELPVSETKRITGNNALRFFGLPEDTAPIERSS